MAKRIMDEKNLGIVPIGGSSYLPLPKEWRTMLERNNLGLDYDEEKHELKIRLVQNNAGQLFVEAWLDVKRPQGVGSCQKK